MKVTSYISAAGVPIRPKTGSFRAWRHLAAETGTKLAVPDSEECPYCGGWLSRNNLEGYGEVWCVCQTLKYGEEYRLIHSQFASPTRDYTLDQLELWGSTEFRNRLSKYIGFFRKWLTWPEKWVTIVGSVGVGKTHILQSLARELWPWSLYITSADLESKLFLALDKATDYTVEDLIFAVSHAPFLFLDDLGAEYGSKFPKATLRRIIDFRYSNPTEKVTVVATNLRGEELINYDERVTDRLADKAIGVMLLLESNQSWRRHGTHTE